MNHWSTLSFATLGLLVGLWHFGSLRWLTRRLIAPSGPDWRFFLPLQLLRMAVLILAGWLAVRQGAWPLLGLGLGVLAARALLLHRVRREGGDRP